MKITVYLDLSRARRKVDRARLTRAQLSELGRLGAALVLKDSTQSFMRQRDPNTGKAWKPSYRAKMQSGQTLLDTGRMRRSVRSDSSVEGQVVTFIGGTLPLIYAPIHQYGGVIRARNKPFLTFRLPDGTWRRAKSVTIPKRPFVGMSMASRKRFDGAIKAAIEKGKALHDG